MTRGAGVGTQVAKLGEAARILMSLTLPAEKRLAGAMTELEFAFLENPPYPGESSVHLKRLRVLLGGEGSWEARAKRLSDDERAEISEVFWRLHQNVIHAFYKEMYQQRAAEE